MTAKEKLVTAMDKLIAKMARAQRDFEAARANAEAIANRESEALENDETYISWTRQKKLAEREAQRLKAELAAVADDIEAEQGRMDRDSLQRRYDGIKNRNAELQTRLTKFASETAPELARLVRDLIVDELQVAEINRLVPFVERLRAADLVVRCAPSVQDDDGRLLRSADDVPPIWETLVIPRLGQHGRHFYDAHAIYGGPKEAIAMIESQISQQE